MANVSLFITCVIDNFYPAIGLGMLRVLDRLGVRHDFPPRQTCCGQPAFNAGYPEEAKAVAAAFAKAFVGSGVIVTPSGSCAAFVRQHLPALVPGAADLAARTYEFAEYLVDVMGVTDLGLALKEPRNAALHNGCHGSRLIGIGPQPQALLSNVRGLNLLDFERSEECCGFGGLFSAKMPEISAAMMNSKLESALGSGADLFLTGDAGCLMHLNGGLSRQRSPKRFQHYAEFLGELC